MSPEATRVAVAGVRGKMGAVTRNAIRAQNDLTYAGGLVRGNAGDEEFTDLGALVSAGRPDVIVDFTRFPDSKAIVLAAMERGIRPVIGTSGYGEDDIAELRAAAERARIGCVFVPNFGIGAVLMMKFAAEAAPHYRAVEIVEMHESGKKDAPSGTATATARRLAAAASFERAPTQTVNLEGARGGNASGVGIHSLRLPGVVAHQEVIFGGDGETLRIVHDSASRASFMRGVLVAVRRARTLTHFVEGLEPLL